jgi:hypothetical protein
MNKHPAQGENLSGNFVMQEWPSKPCKHCRWLDRLVDCGFGTQVAHCNNPKCSRVRSMPEHGCAAFEREPGSDDE